MKRYGNAKEQERKDKPELFTTEVKDGENNMNLPIQFSETVDEIFENKFSKPEVVNEQEDIHESQG